MEVADPSIESQFEDERFLGGPSLRTRFHNFLNRFLSFRVIRVLLFIVIVFIWAVLFYGIENNYNPIYALGRNLTNGTTSTPPTGTPTELAFIDALFNSMSFWTSTGLSTADFSQWCFASQVVGLFAMMIGSLLINTSIPLWVRLAVTRHKVGTNVYKHADYWALVMVACMIAVYFAFFALLMGTFFAIYCSVSEVRSIFVTATPPIDPWFGGYFLAFSAFANCGFSPFGSSVVPFVQFPGFILWLGAFMLTGNIAFPAILRLLLAAMGALGMERRWGLPIERVQRNPRAYYQLLFPAQYVIYLSCLWMALCLVNWGLVMGLEWNNTMSGLSGGQKLATAIFTTMTNRTAGLNVLLTGNFRGAYLAFDMAMFVISSNPNAIAIRATRNEQGKSVKQYTTELLINVVAGLTLSWILILLFEYSNPWVQTPFPTLFEVASAFGTVGLSMGFGSSNTSLSGAYSIPSKLVIMVLMIVGAHRTLPENVDSAIRVQEIPSGHVVATEVKLVSGTHRRFLTKVDLNKAFL